VPLNGWHKRIVVSMNHARTMHMHLSAARSRCWRAALNIACGILRHALAALALRAWWRMSSAAWHQNHQWQYLAATACNIVTRKRRGSVSGVAS